MGVHKASEIQGSNKGYRNLLPSIRLGFLFDHHESGVNAGGVGPAADPL